MTEREREVHILTRERLYTMGICTCKQTYKRQRQSLRDRESQLLPTREREYETENHNYYRFYMVHIYEDPTSERQLTLLLFPGLGPAAKWKNPNTGGVKTMFFFL